MKRKIFILKLKILKHKIVVLFWRMLCLVLTPFSLIYGIIIGIYGFSKGMTKDEIMERYVEKYLEIIIRKLTRT